MDVRICNDLSGIQATDWNELTGSVHPFVRHEFLRALETSGCVGGDSGWQPRYLLASVDNALVGALPLYAKQHSYGEFVFDWAWARAYAQHGLKYYPKLLVGIPFTPVTGPRLLIAAGAAHQEKIAHALVARVRSLADESAMSSIHWLFTNEADTALLEAVGYQRRVGCQFHWRNRGYRDFDDFLSTFSAAKRKKLKRERRAVREAGIAIEIRTGADIETIHWEAMYRFYRATVDAHGAIPYLNPDFFAALADTFAQNVVMVLAREGARYIAGALNIRSADALYGRYWGTVKPVSGLHFEVCYYRAIEYCIDEGLTRFEAGAQGEHKIARGFAPTATYSAHWLRHPRFAQAVETFLASERAGVHAYIDELGGHLPFKDDNAAGGARPATGTR